MKNTTIFSLIFFGVCCLSPVMYAQKLAYGFKIGLNSANIQGPTNEWENYATKTGFHIGGVATLGFNDYLSVRAELLYSRRGSNYSFGTASKAAPMYRTFTSGTNSVLTTGSGDFSLGIDNSYLEFPLTVRLRYKKFELDAGLAASVNIGSSGEGVLHYTGTDVNGSSTGRIEYVLVYNFRKDKVGESPAATAFVPAAQTISVGGRTYETPGSLASKTDLKVDPGKRFNPFDLAAVGGLNYYFNKTLYLQGRVHYGLQDITNNKADLRLDQNDGTGGPLFSDDFDRNFMIQFSVGFNF